MNRPWLLLLGGMATVVASLLGIVWAANWQLYGLAPALLKDAEGREVTYPQPLDESDAAPGRRVYMAQGCIYCHSQQVRSASFGADISRGWGERRSVARDYLWQSPPLLGSMRTGPDVANIGMRQPADAWHHLHLYDARLVSPGSIMPPFGYLYRVVDREPAPPSYRLPGTAGQPPRSIVPSQAARDLVAYLKALRQEHALSEVQ